VVDQRCRVTVVGASKQADVALPARAAIGEYVHSLAALCGQEETDGMPAAWSLGMAGRAPLPSSVSLEGAGIADGQLLYLRDLTEGEYDEPVLLEVDEQVASTLDRISGPRWAPAIMASVTLIVSAVWLTAAAIFWLLTARDDRTLAGAVALGAGCALAAAAWLGRSRGLGVSRVMRLILAVSVVPCWASAGWFIGLNAAGGDLKDPGVLAAALVGLAAGAGAGALAALAAVPGIATTALAVLTVAAAAATWLFVGLETTGHEVIAVVAVVAYGLVILSPSMAGHLAALWQDLSREQDTELAVVWAHSLTLSCTVIAAAGLVVTLGLAGAARNPYDIALTVVLSGALLLRAGTCKFLAEAVPIMVAGFTGLFAVAMEAPRYWGQPGWVSALAVSALGLATLVLGMTLTFGHSAMNPAGPDRGTTARAVAPPGKRAAAVRIALTLCWVAALPLAAGTFGLFGHMISMGRHL
jgi:WXG100 protein secretion system (Wss), protein YukD